MPINIDVYTCVISQVYTVTRFSKSTRMPKALFTWGSLALEQMFLFFLFGEGFIKPRFKATALCADLKSIHRPKKRSGAKAVSFF